MATKIRGIRVEFIPQEQQRYPTVGDWAYEGDMLVLKISEMPKEVWQHAILLHELTEALLCYKAGVSQAAVDAFDMGPGKDLDEPGFSPDAPYHRQHCWSDVVERVFIAASGESWSEYDAAVSDSGQTT